ncbi:hypothetical protein EGT81_19745 [Alcaligenes faecalis]|uniref:hypothetical protein n=1 Tax=Alcaligenes faecalis TaxID=511 RepID=UPI000F65FB5A|nr:hypothetical protein [Alcaligenes faecalis]RSE57668.1 hypothetical protein EGT81_19745 [Alcaligenes faecalis]
MVQKLINHLHRLFRIDGPMSSHRRTAPADRNAIQINVMAQRFTEIGKTFLYGGSATAITMHVLGKQAELWAGIVIALAGIAFFLLRSSLFWLVREKQARSLPGDCEAPA